MPTNVTPADAWTTPVPVPANGEPANAASIIQYVQPLADRLEFLRKRVIGASAQSVRLHVPVLVPGQANWTVSASPYPSASCNVSSLQTLGIPIQPFGALVSGGPQAPAITQIGVMILGNSGHAALPANMPRLRLVSYNSAAAAGGAGLIPETIHADVGDTAPNVASYQVWHYIQQTLGVPVSYNPTAQYGLQLLNEFGANAVAGLTIGQAWIEVTSL